MKYCLPAILLLTVIISQCGLAATPRERTPPGSFLKYRVSTVSQLVNQISTNSTVKARYARHFGISSEHIISYFGSNLKLISLKIPIKARSYYITRSGRIMSKIKLLPRGTLVFATSGGKPLLSQSCGNPLRADIPHTLQKRHKKSAAPTAAAVKGKSIKKPIMSGMPSAKLPIETKVLAAAPEMIGAPPLASAPNFMPVTEAAPILLADSSPIVGGSALSAVAPALSEGTSGLAAIGGLAGLLGGLAAAANNDSNNNPIGPTPASPVPEPGSIVTIGFGLSAIGASLIHRRKALKRECRE